MQLHPGKKAGLLLFAIAGTVIVASGTAQARPHHRGCGGGGAAVEAAGFMPRAGAQAVAGTPTAAAAPAPMRGTLRQCNTRHTPTRQGPCTLVNKWPAPWTPAVIKRRRPIRRLPGQALGNRATTAMLMRATALQRRLTLQERTLRAPMALL